MKEVRRGRSGNVLVTDAESRASLATARGLWKSRYTVTGAASIRVAPGHWSRSCAHRTFVRDPHALPLAYVDDLVDALARRAFAALVPTTDIALQLVSHHRHRLPAGVATGLPDHDVVERCLEKPNLVDVADAFELSAPASISCTGEAQAVAAAKDFGFPVVLKPTRSVVAHGARFVRRPATLVRDEHAARRVARTLGERVVVQRFEPAGRILAVGGVATPDGVRAWVAARWHRRWPPLDGATSFCETVAPPAGLLERIEGVLRTLGHVGIFELELLERRDGTLAALDLNPRPFGWMTLAVSAGANLPAIWCDWLLGRERETTFARPGVRYRWEDGELKHLLWQLRRGHLRAGAAVLRPRARVAHAYFELTDPAPLAAAFLHVARGQMQHVKRRT